MRRSIKLIGLGAIVSGCAVWCMTAGFGGAMYWTPPLWFDYSYLRIQKVTELSADSLATRQQWCDVQYLRSAYGQRHAMCTFSSPLGQLTEEGMLVTSSSTTALLEGPVSGSWFLPSADPAVMLVALPAENSAGQYIGVYHKGSLKRAVLANYVGSEQYKVTKQPDQILRDTNGNPRVFDATKLAYSANGDWMVVPQQNGGIVRYSAHTFYGGVLSGSYRYEIGGSGRAESLAITNDGKMVALSTIDNQERPLLWVYYVTNVYGTYPCLVDDYDAAEGWCLRAEPWQDSQLEGALHYGGAIQQSEDEFGGIEKLMNIRFVDDEVLSFDGIYGSGKAAYFTLGRDGSSGPAIGLLGMGDSYSSGQGTYMYRSDTDTGDNNCHTSELSYQYLLGKNNFDSYASVACSGAKTEDFTSVKDKYEGQVKAKIPKKSRLESDVEKYIGDFTHGYVVQTEFAEIYKPEAIVLTIGGNDIGFGDILTRCILHAKGDGCYQRESEREALATKINSSYSDILKTLKELRERSGGSRVYIAGYPQIAKADGKCGVNVLLNKDERQFAVGVITALNRTIAAAAQAAGVRYVDVSTAFYGHRLCENTHGQPAVNGLTAGDDKMVKLFNKELWPVFIGEESYHPTVLGNDLLADEIDAKTNGASLSMPDPVLPTGGQVEGRWDEVRRDLGITIASHAETKSYAMTEQTVKPNQSLVVKIDGGVALLAMNSPYEAILFSEPVLLASGNTDENGDLQTEISIPATVPTGFHTLHVYTTNLLGQAIDIQQSIYVTNSLDDLNGDGIDDTTTPCGALSASGLDTDGDAIDDACDPIIPDVSEDMSTSEQSGTASVASSNQPYSAQTGKTNSIQVIGGSAIHNKVESLARENIDSQPKTIDFTVSPNQSGHRELSARGSRISWWVVGGAICSAVLIAVVVTRVARRS